MIPKNGARAGSQAGRVALTCARALLARKESRHTWVLLRSTRPEEREQAAAWVAEHGLPEDEHPELPGRKLKRTKPFKTR